MSATEETVVLSLKDLKEQNKDVPRETPEVIEEKTKEVTESTETVEDSTETTVETTEEPKDPQDEWLKGEKKAPTEADFAAAGARKKWKSRYTEQKEKNDEIIKENERLKKELEAKSIVTNKVRPKREDFDSEEKYEDALYDYRASIDTEKNQQIFFKNEQRRIFEEKQKKIDKDLDAHYIRVESLAKKSGISEDAYKGAELKFRGALDTLFPGIGDNVADELISSMGEGSEKVVYHLSINDEKLAKLTNLFRENPSGIKAAAYLGQLASTLSAPAKRTSRAPEPMDEIKGDKKTPSANAANEKKMREDYQRAHSSHDGQKAWALKKQAREAGIDTSSW